jgi:hypothetical protein
MLLGRCCLLQSIVDHQVQEEVVAAQSPADFAPTLEMNEQLLVHELRHKFSLSRISAATTE